MRYDVDCTLQRCGLSYRATVAVSTNARSTASLSLEVNALREQARGGVCPNGEAADEHWVLSGYLARAVVGLASLSLFIAGPAGLSYLRRQPLGLGDDTRLRPHPHTRADVLVYHLETYFSSSRSSKPVALLAITGLLIVCGSGVLYAVSGSGLYTSFWHAIAGVGLDWTFIGDDTAGFLHRVVALFLSVGGMLVTALLVSLISEAFSSRMDELRRGKSDVLETHHTLILGWSDKVIPMIRQLALANESEGGGVVVVLALKDKEEMDDEVRRLGEKDLLGTRVICRQGSALLASDLGRVSVRTARAIVVLADDGTGRYTDSADVNTLRVVLVLSHLRDNGGLEGHVVTELFDIDNEPLIHMIGGESVHTLVSHDVIGRLMLQCARQPGLAAVFEDLICFEGSEFYFQQWEALEGRTFGEICFMFEDAVCCGLEENGRVFLNPPDSTVFTSAHRLIALAEDDDSYQPSAAPFPLEGDDNAHTPSPAAAVSEKILFVGWRRDLQDLVAALDEFVGPGSELYILSDIPEPERRVILLQNGMDPERDLHNLTLKHVVGDPVSRKSLATLPLERFDSVLLLAHGAEDDDQQVMDSKTLTTLLQIRTIQTERLTRAAAPAGEPPSPLARTLSTSDQNRSLLSIPQSPVRHMGKLAESKLNEFASASPSSAGSFWNADMRANARRCPVISEILNLQTRHLVAEMGICDYVLSNELVSNAIAAVAEEPLMSRVWDELFRAEGNELYVLPARLYLQPGERLSFFQLSKRLRARSEILLGMACSDDPASFRQRAAGGDAAAGEGVRRAVLNPPDKGKPLRWDLKEDFLVVLACDIKI